MRFEPVHRNMPALLNQPGFFGLVNENAARVKAVFAATTVRGSAAKYGPDYAARKAREGHNADSAEITLKGYDSNKRDRAGAQIAARQSYSAKREGIEHSLKRALGAVG